MRVIICEDKHDLGYLAAKQGVENINSCIQRFGYCNVAFITGSSQLLTLEHLSKADINWSKVNIYHLSEFVGLDGNHVGSSENFLNKYFLSKISKTNSYHPIKANESNVEETIRSLNEELKDKPLDVSFICIGENGHLAFNDPPADFNTSDPYILIDLEKRSRRQQFQEGWFNSFDEVPHQAITMSISKILSSRYIIVSCPDQRKAKAVASALFEDLSPQYPATSLRHRRECTLFLDRQSSILVYGDRRQ